MHVECEQYEEYPPESSHCSRRVFEIYLQESKLPHGFEYDAYDGLIAMRTPLNNVFTRLDGFAIRTLRHAVFTKYTRTGGLHTDSEGEVSFSDEYMMSLIYTYRGLHG